MCDLSGHPEPNSKSAPTKRSNMHCNKRGFTELPSWRRVAMRRMEAGKLPILTQFSASTKHRNNDYQRFWLQSRSHMLDDLWQKSLSTDVAFGLRWFDWVDLTNESSFLDNFLPLRFGLFRIGWGVRRGSRLISTNCWGFLAINREDLTRFLNRS